jgi:hypothetical protein
MLGYIIVFTGLGFLLAIFLKNEVAYLWIGIITVGWAILMGPWAIATLIELSLGYSIGRGLRGVTA